MNTRRELLSEIMGYQRYVVQKTIDNTIKQYELNKKNYDKNPIKLLNMLRSMFGPRAENIAETYYDYLSEKDLD